MLHKTRWTSQKIAQRLRLIEPFVYRQSRPIPPFQYTTLPGPEVDPPVGLNVDDAQWQTIAPNSYWGNWTTDFVMRSMFEIPPDCSGSWRGSLAASGPPRGGGCRRGG